MAQRTYKAFVSSTYEDLADHRAHVIEELRKAGIHVDPMEYWTAESDEPKEFSQERVDGCDFCVLLVAWRRGFVPEGEELSITQLEYHAARAAGIDVLVYLLDERHPWPPMFTEKDPKIEEWRHRLATAHGRQVFGPDPTSIQLGPAIARWLNKQVVNRAIDLSDAWRQLTADWLHLEADAPTTSEVAAELLPNVVAAAKALYSQLAERRGDLPQPSTSDTATESPTEKLIAGARDFLADAEAFHRTCFVLMPFGRKLIGDREVDFDEVYADIFAPAIRAVRLPEEVGGYMVPRRADELFLTGDISHEMFKYLEYARLVLADITGLNANVLYELGHRHRARPSGTAIFRQPDAPIPFDINIVNAFPYSTEPVQEAQRSRNLITKVLQASIDNIRKDSPSHLAHDRE